MRVVGVIIVLIRFGFCAVSSVVRSVLLCGWFPLLVLKLSVGRAFSRDDIVSANVDIVEVLEFFEHGAGRSDKTFDDIASDSDLINRARYL